MDLNPKMTPAYLMYSNTTDIVIMNTLGIIVSLYALYVETMKHKNKEYKAFCDFGENMQCSKVLTSEYSKGFGLVKLLVGEQHFLNAPNCVLGIIFFTLQIVLSQLSSPWATYLLYYTSIVSVLGCFYLAFILFFILKDVCLVCMATYVVNGVLLYLNYQRQLAL